MKKQKFKYAEQQALDTCVRQREALLAGLGGGTVSLSQNGQKLWLRPGATVDLELCAEQSGEREQLEIRLSWRRASLHVVTRSDDAPPQTVRNWQRIHREALAADGPGDNPLSVRHLDTEMVAHYQELYSAARRPSGAEGQHRLDEARFLISLEQAGISPPLRQELYDLALRAEADGRSTLFAPEVIAALRKAS